MNVHKTLAPMTLRQYWKSVGSDIFDEVAKAAGLNPKTARQVAYRNKNISPTSAKLFIEAAMRLTPTRVPDYVTIIEPLTPEEKLPKKATGKPKLRKTFEPSPEFQQEINEQSTGA